MERNCCQALDWLVMVMMVIVRISKQINNITSPQSFMIPESDVPNSPFIAKFSDKNSSVYKKEIPVR